MKLRDQSLIESVLMGYEHGQSICVSTQVGCAFGCSFCASTKGGFKRNLTAGEILAQVIAVNSDLGEGRNISNIVLMGSGEPLDNLENVTKFLKLINLKDGLNVSMRNISVSTCGLADKIRQLEPFPITLCLSLHSAFQYKREMLMPIAKRFGIDETMDALKEYQKKTGRRVIIEYILIEDFNDKKEDALELKKILTGLNCHVNLIRYNYIEEGGYLPTPVKKAYAFLDMLTKLSVSATLRRTLGQDIDGACGQLRARRVYKEEI
jgi:23S rRNA (adenine2503-C2)-methyltransferase